MNFVHLGALLSESESEKEDDAEGSLVNGQEDGDRQHDCECYYSDKIADQKCVPFVHLKYISAVA